MKLFRILPPAFLLVACLFSALLGCGGGGGGGGSPPLTGTSATQAQFQAKGGTISYSLSNNNRVENYTYTLSPGGSGTWSMSGTNNATNPPSNISGNGNLNWSHSIGSTNNPQTGTLVTSGATTASSNPPGMSASGLNNTNAITFNNNLTGGTYSNSHGSGQFTCSVNP